jgi:hypothetical protein
MAKKIDPKAKAKRQKIMVAVGGVILLGLLAFQVPRTMKMLHQKGADSAAATTTSASTTTTPTGSAMAAGAAPVSAAAGVDGLGDPDSLPAPQSGQLLAFSRFRTKDPFAQQLDVACAGSGTSSDGSAASCGSGSGSTSTSTSTSGPSKKSSAPSTPPSDGGSVAPVSPTTPPVAVARPTTAKISVNGTSETVQVGADFPASNPTFTLVSLTKTSAKIAIAGGSLESGGPTVTLAVGKPLTLMNTADGTRYVLRLLSVG